METKKIELGHPVSVSRFTLVPVTETLVNGWENLGRAGYFGTKRPLYILVISPDKPIKAFHVNGQETPLDKIISENPEIKEDLERLRGA